MHMPAAAPFALAIQVIPGVVGARSVRNRLMLTCSAASMHAVHLVVGRSCGKTWTYLLYGVPRLIGTTRCGNPIRVTCVMSVESRGSNGVWQTW